MGTVCFIVDASVAGACLPRHLRSIRQSGLAEHLVPVIVTAAFLDERFATLEHRFHAHCLVTPEKKLGARLNQAAYVSQAEWLLVAMHKQVLPAQLWPLLYPELDTQTLDALIISAITPRLPERLWQQLRGPNAALPPYMAISRTWLERLGGFDPELEVTAMTDLLQRLHACPTRLKTLSGQALGLPRGSPLSALKARFSTEPPPH
ncbi:hypothetical protein [Halomonas sp. 18071143]|uniref:hypothetical protein n=1 Tax=Halomonas sp. 18071143 TaxID=2855441 RepID=UPI001C4937E6|nr:hypothetical protein [Halomonas sp. 18071143]